MSRMQVLTIACHQIGPYSVKIYSRSDLDVAAVVSTDDGVRGKYLLSSGWESEPDLGKYTAAITKWVEESVRKTTTART